MFFLSNFIFLLLFEWKQLQDSLNYWKFWNGALFCWEIILKLYILCVCLMWKVDKVNARIFKKWFSNDFWAWLTHFSCYLFFVLLTSCWQNILSYNWNEGLASSPPLRPFLLNEMCLFVPLLKCNWTWISFNEKTKCVLKKKEITL